MAWVPAAIGAAGSILGGIIGKKGAQEQNVANAQQAQKQMDFEERMSNTAVRRRVADLEAAGLNKMLAYSDSATTPSGAQARMENVNAIPAGSAVEAGKRISEAALVKAQTNKLNAETRLADSSAAVNAASISQEIPARVGSLNASAAQANANARLASEQIKKVMPEVRQLLSAADRNDAEASLARISELVKGLDAESQRRVMEFVVSLKDSESQRERFNLPRVRNEAALQEAMGQFGAVRGWMAPALETAGAAGMWIEEMLKGSWDFVNRRAEGRRGGSYGR